MLDKDKLREKRMKEAEESVNIWGDFLTSSENDEKKEAKKDEKKK